MVDPRSTDAAVKPIDTTTPALGERELQITIWHDDFAKFKGSAAQLVPEGVIPKGFKWPHAAEGKRWEANGFDYCLGRAKPEGWKGPMKSWFEVDNWFIVVRVTGRTHHEMHRLRLGRESAELHDEYLLSTPAGRREWDANFRRYLAARNDKGFQAFMALIPGLIPAKRGRKAKATPSGDAA